MDARYVLPPHEVRDDAKLAAIAASMRVDGWVGRPILAYDDGNGVHALTGSHRIAAARAVGIDVPVHIIDLRSHGDLCTGDGCWCVAMVIALEDEPLMAALERSGDHMAIQLMQYECLVDR